jgi:hypothetical protein
MINFPFLRRSAFLALMLLGFFTNSGWADENPQSNQSMETLVTVTALNYVTAKTASQFDKYLASAGGQVNTLNHHRALVDVNAKSSKRLNRDTLYSVAIVDISQGAILVMPDPGDRYVSVQVVNELGYTNKVFYGQGRFSLTMDEFDTPFVWLLVRTLVSESIPGDIKAANKLQDLMAIQSASSKPYVHPNYDAVSFEKTTRLLVELGAGINSNSGAAGKKGEVDPVMQLLAAAYGFGTLPESASYLVNVQPNLPADQAYTITVGDVPVDGFWSVAVYNKDGYFEENPYGAYGVNDRTAVRNDDGSITIHLGGNPDQDNFIPIVDGWNYVVRLYRPRAEILTGEWVFPSVSIVE